MTLDPIVTKDVGSAQAIERIFDGHYTFDSDTGIVPQIASGPLRRRPTEGNCRTPR